MLKKKTSKNLKNLNLKVYQWGTWKELYVLGMHCLRKPKK